MIEIEGKEYICALDYGVELIKGKWKAVIICYLHDQPLRFTGLQKKLTGVSQKMLTEKLRELEEDGLVKRVVHTRIPPKVEYCLTQWGIRLHGIFRILETWSNDYISDYRSLPYVERKKPDN